MVAAAAPRVIISLMTIMVRGKMLKTVITVFLLFNPILLLTQETDMKYFESAETAVLQIKALLLKEDWQELGKYYSLDNSEYTREQVSDSSFYLREDIPEVHHPTDNPVYARPFDPSYNFNYTEESDGLITVWLIKKIEQGAGELQIGIHSFKIVRKEKGLQLIAE